MAEDTIKCDECEKKDCNRRLVGALCSLQVKEISPIIRALGTRDPVLISRFLADIAESELDRYEKAKKAEAIGEVKEEVVVDKLGEVHRVTTVGKVDNNVTSIAANLVKTGKVINDVLNPVKAIPGFQQNNQYNISVGAVSEINKLGPNDKMDVLRFIDDKLDAKRS